MVQNYYCMYIVCLYIYIYKLASISTFNRGSVCMWASSLLHNIKQKQQKIRGFDDIFFREFSKFDKNQKLLDTDFVI